jgi:signal transduction histidine kinase
MTRALSLRTRLFVIVLLGAVLPLAIVGTWLARSTARSGETLLRERLAESLNRVATDIGGRWVPLRSDLITLAERAAVLSELSSAGAPPIPADDVLAGSSGRLARSIHSAALRTRGNHQVILMPPRRADAAGVTATIAIHDRVSGEAIGALEARVAIASLVPVSIAFNAAAGAVLQVVDRPTRTPLLPAPFEASLALQDEFSWQGDRWISARTALGEPEIDLIVSAPVSSFTQPFEAAGRRGLVGLIAVLVFVLVVTTLLTGQTTRSLRSLADAATAIAGGEYGRTVPVYQPDEVGRAATAFNAMSASLRRTLDELAQRQSFAAVGEFAASLAHEVRNPLTSVRLDLQRLEEKMRGEPRLSELASRALRAVVRLDATVSGALRVARSGRLTLDPLDIREPLGTAIRDVEPECRARRIEVTLNDQAADNVIKGDRTALHQVFLNLLLNAAQAIESNGRIQVAIDRVADLLCVTVRDTGPGVAPDVRSRIFDPLFSTKPEGSGLGLAIAQRIVAGHGGELLLDSQPGEGTTVTVRLPVTDAS